MPGKDSSPAMSAAQAFLPSLFQSEELADCDIRFCQDPSCIATSKPDAAATPAGCSGAHSRGPVWLSERIPAHKIVLVPSSERLKAQLLSPGWQHPTPEPDHTQQAQVRPEHDSESAATAASALQRPLLALPLEGPHEVAPATEVLRFMYRGALSPGLAPMQLLMTYKLAQYLLCAGCGRACAGALAALARIPYEDSYIACTSPSLACMLDQPELARFMGSCAAALARRYASTLEVARSEELSRAFAGLPLAVVRVLLDAGAGSSSRSSGRMPIDCEETVLLLLHRWVQRNGPVSCEVAAQLRKLVRPLQLSPEYLHHVLPCLEWLGLSAEHHRELAYAVHAASAAQAQGVAVAMLTRLAERLRTVSGVFRAEPQWLLARGTSLLAFAKRHGTSGSSSGNTGKEGSASASASGSDEMTMTAEWSRQELERALERAARLGTCQITAPAVYWAGHMWSMLVDIVAKEETVQQLVGSGISAVRKAPADLYMRSSLPADFGIEDAAVCGRASRFSFQVQGTGGGAKVMRDDVGFCPPTTANSFGWRPFFGDTTLAVASWEPFIVDGYVRVKGMLWR